MRLQESLLALAMVSVCLPMSRSGFHTYPPWVVELEAGRSNGLVCLSTHEARQSAVAFHHWFVVSNAQHEVMVERLYFAVSMLAATRCASAYTTHPVPCIDAPSRPLSSVLDLLELSDRHGAEGEELRAG
jgi:hypothetical protein